MLRSSRRSFDEDLRARETVALATTALSDTENPLTFIDVFAGCGGLSLGLFKAGWRGLFALEKDVFAFDTLKANFITDGGRYHFDWPGWLAPEPHDIRKVLKDHRSRLRGLRGRIDLMAGGPPCQGFSSAGKRREDDPRNRLFRSYLELVELVRPRMVLVENVLGFERDFKARRLQNGSGTNYAKRLKTHLSKRYVVFSSTLRAADYGVPQERPRFFLFGILKRALRKMRFSCPFSLLQQKAKDLLEAIGFPSKTTAAQALSDLTVARNGTIPCEDSRGYEAIGYKSPLTKFQRAIRDGYVGTPSDTRLAKHRPHIVVRFGRIQKLCKKTGRLRVQLSAAAKAQFGIEKQATRVLDPKQSSPTITSMPDDLLHYNEPRTLTVRENARLQTFPDWFVFRGKYTTGGERRRREVPRFTQVANAVPPLMAYLIGSVIGMEYRRLKSIEAHR